MIPFCRSLGGGRPRACGHGRERPAGAARTGSRSTSCARFPRTSSSPKAFAERFDGFSIGSNDLTQLTLGVDRDSEELAELFDEQDEAVKWMIENVIREAHKAGAKIGLCGQAPSDHPEFAEFLVDCGIDSISVSPDSFIAVKQKVAAAEAGAKQRRRDDVR